MKNNSLLVIAFMGVDGSGKSTIISNLKSLLDEKYDNIIINHLKPNLFGINRPIQSNNPHSQPLRSSLFSLLKIIYWMKCATSFVIICLVSGPKCLYIIFPCELTIKVSGNPNTPNSNPINPLLSTPTES